MRLTLPVSQILLISLLFTFAVGTASAREIPRITTADLKARMDAGQQLVLANALSAIEHDDNAIKGSVNIPAEKLEGNANLPADKDTLLIFYCLGPKCGKSHIAARDALSLGYTNVMIYDEGLPAWAQHRYPLERAVEYPRIEVERLSPKQVHDMQTAVVILDIRGAKHKELGTINGASEIALEDLKEEYGALPKGKKIVIIDHAAKQVVVAAKFLALQGYKDVAVMDGGVTAWLRAGLPVNK